MRNKVKEYEVLIKHINIEPMIVNLMTKALPVKQYRDHMNCMGLTNSFYVWLHFFLVVCLDIFLYVIFRDQSDVLCT